jgi:hypothetical protein
LVLQNPCCFLFGLPGGCFLRLSLNPFRYCLQQLGSVGCQLLLLSLQRSAAFCSAVTAVLKKMRVSR